LRALRIKKHLKANLEPRKVEINSIKLEMDLHHMKDKTSKVVEAKPKSLV